MASAYADDALASLRDCMTSLITADLPYALCVMNSGLFALADNETAVANATALERAITQQEKANKIATLDDKLGVCRLQCTASCVKASSSCCKATENLRACQLTNATQATEQCKQTIENSLTYSNHECGGLAPEDTALISITSVLVALFLVLFVVIGYRKHKSKTSEEHKSWFDGFVAFLRQVRNLIWKNLTLHRRRPVAFLVQYLLPLLFVGALVIIVNLDVMRGRHGGSVYEDSHKATWLNASERLVCGALDDDWTPILMGAANGSLRQFYSFGQSVLGFLFLISFVKFVSSTTASMVHEKEIKLRALMKAHGISEFVLYFSWTMTILLVSLPLLFVIAAMLKYGSVFPATPYATVLFVFWALIVVMIAFSYFMMAWFQKARTAALISVIVWFILFVPFFAVQSRSSGHKYAAALAPPTAFALAIDHLLREAQMGIGFAYSMTASFPAQKRAFDDVPTATAMAWFMLLDAFLLFAFGWYFGQVISFRGEAGQRWNFLCRAKCWCLCWWRGSSKDDVAALPPTSPRAEKDGIASPRLEAGGFTAMEDKPKKSWWSTLWGASRTDEQASSLMSPQTAKMAASTPINGGAYAAMEDEDMNRDAYVNVSEDKECDHEIATGELALQEQSGDLLKLRSLHKTYKVRFGMDRVAVNRLNVSAYSGQVLAFLGNKGAGKTTLVEMLAGHVTPTSGDAVLYGQSLRLDGEQFHQHVSICPRYDELYLEMTVYEHLHFFATMKFMSEASILAMTESLLLDFDLAEVSNTLVLNLSIIQRRKLCLAIALLGESKLVVFDEPTLDMDQATRRQVWTILRKYREGRVLVITTQSAYEADIVADRVAIVVDGRVKCSGSVAFLKARIGSGYRLVLSKASTEQFQVAPVERFLVGYIPSAKFVSESDSEVTFQLPADSTATFATLFAALERELHVLWILKYRIMVTTLNDVLARASAEAANEEEQLGSATEATGPAAEIPTITPPSAVSLSAPSFWTQYFTMLKMHLRMLWRDRKLLLVAVGVPLLLFVVLIALPELKVATLLQDYSSGYPSASEQASCSAADISARVLNTNALEQCRASDYGFCDLDVVDCDAAVCCDARDYRSPYYACSTCALASSSGKDSPPCYNDKCMDRAGAKLQVVLKGFLVAMIVMLAFAFIPAAMITWIVREKNPQQDLRSLQLTSGMSVNSYWWSHYTRDFLLVLILIIGALIAMPLSNRALSGSSEVWALLVLVFIHVLVIILLTYLFSRGFTNYARAQMWIFVFVLGSGGILSIFSFVCRVTDFEFSSTFYLSDLDRDYLRWFFLIFPGYALNNGIFELATRKITRGSLYGPSRDTDPQSSFFGLNRGFGKDEDCTACWESNVEGCCVRGTMDFDVLFAPIIYMLVEAFLIILFVYFFEKCGCVCRCRWWCRWLCCKSSAQQTGKALNGPTEDDGTDEEDEDHDISMERQRVAELNNGVADADDVIVLQDVEYRYSTGQVGLRGLNLAVRRGEFIGLVGESGSGKTTLAKLLTRQIIASKGSVSVGGQEVNAAGQFKAQDGEFVGYCPQFSALHDTLTVEEELTLYANVRGIKAHLIQQEVEEKMTQLGLLEWRAMQTSLLTFVIKRKLSLAIALLGNPRLVVLDEPSTGLDLIARRRMWSLLSKLCVSKRITILLLTRSMEECEAVCSRVGILVNGKMKCLGSVEHLQQKLGNGYTMEVSVDEDSTAAELERLESEVRSLAFAEGSAEADLTAEQAVKLAVALHRPARGALLMSTGRREGWLVRSASGSYVIRVERFCMWWLRQNRIEFLIEYFMRRFMGIRVIEHHGVRIRFYIPSSGSDDMAAVSKETIFSVLAEEQAPLRIRNYEVTDTSVDDVYFNIATSTTKVRSERAVSTPQAQAHRTISNEMERIDIEETKDEEAVTPYAEITNARNVRTDTIGGTLTSLEAGTTPTHFAAATGAAIIGTAAAAGVAGVARGSSASIASEAGVARDASASISSEAAVAGAVAGVAAGTAAAAGVAGVARGSSVSISSEAGVARGSSASISSEAGVARDASASISSEAAVAGAVAGVAAGTAAAAGVAGVARGSSVSISSEAGVARGSSASISSEAGVARDASASISSEAAVAGAVAGVAAGTAAAAGVAGVARGSSVSISSEAGVARGSSASISSEAGVARDASASISSEAAVAGAVAGVAAGTAAAAGVAGVARGSSVSISSEAGVARGSSASISSEAGVARDASASISSEAAVAGAVAGVAAGTAAAAGVAGVARGSSVSISSEAGVARGSSASISSEAGVARDASASISSEAAVAGAVAGVAAGTAAAAGVAGVARGSSVSISSEAGVARGSSASISSEAGVARDASASISSEAAVAGAVAGVAAGTAAAAGVAGVARGSSVSISSEAGVARGSSASISSEAGVARDASASISSEAAVAGAVAGVAAGTAAAAGVAGVARGSSVSISSEAGVARGSSASIASEAGVARDASASISSEAAVAGAVAGVAAGTAAAAGVAGVARGSSVSISSEAGVARGSSASIASEAGVARDASASISSEAAVAGAVAGVAAGTAAAAGVAGVARGSSVSISSEAGVARGSSASIASEAGVARDASASISSEAAVAGAVAGVAAGTAAAAGVAGVARGSSVSISSEAGVARGSSASISSEAGVARDASASISSEAAVAGAVAGVAAGTAAAAGVAGVARGSSVSISSEAGVARGSSASISSEAAVAGAVAGVAAGTAAAAGVAGVARGSSVSISSEAGVARGSSASIASEAGVARDASASISSEAAVAGAVAGVAAGTAAAAGVAGVARGSSVSISSEAGVARGSSASIASEAGVARDASASISSEAAVAGAVAGVAAGTAAAAGVAGVARGSSVSISSETGFSLALSVEEESSPVELKRVESEVRSVVGFAEGSEEAHLSADQVENLAAALQQPGRGSLLMSAGRREGWLVRTETGSYVIRVQRFCIWWVRQTRIEVLVQYLTRRFVGIRVIEQHGVRIRFFIPSAGSDGKTTVSKDTIFRVLSQEQAQLRIGSYDVADTSAAEVRSQVSSPRQSGEVQYYTTAQSDNQVDASSSLQSQSRVVGGYTTTTVKGGEERVIVQGQQQQQQPGAVHYSTTTVGSAPASSSSVSTSTVRQAAESGFSLALSVEEESSPVELKRVESEVRSVVGFAEGSEEAHLSADQVENLAAALQQPGRGSLLMSAGRREGWLVRTETGSYVIRVQRFCIWWVRQTRIEVLVQYLTRRFVGIRVIEQHGVRIRFFIPSAGSDGKTTVSKDTIFRVLSQEQAQLRIGSYDVADTSAAEVRSQVSSPRQSGEVQYYTTAQSDNQVDASSSLQSQSRVVGGYTTTTVKGGEERVIVQGQQQQQQPGAVHYSTTTVGSAPASSSSVSTSTVRQAAESGFSLALSVEEESSPVELKRVESEVRSVVGFAEGSEEAHLSADQVENLAAALQQPGRGSLLMSAGRREGWLVRTETGSYVIRVQRFCIWWVRQTRIEVLVQYLTRRFVGIRVIEQHGVRIRFFIPSAGSDGKTTVSKDTIFRVLSQEQAQLRIGSYDVADTSAAEVRSQVSSPRQSGEVQYYTTAQSDNQVDASSSLQSQSRVVGGYTTTTVKGGEERVIVQGQQQQQQPGAVHYSTTTVGSAPASSSSVSTSTVRQAAETGFSLALSVEEESSPVELKRVESEVRSVVGFAEGSEEAHLSADQVENLAAALQQPGRGSLLMSAGRREGWLVRTETGSYVIRVQRFCIWWVRQTRIEVLVQYLTRRFVGIRVIEQHGVRIRFFIPSAGSDGKTTVSKDTIFRVLSQEQAQLRIGSYDVADTSAAEVRSQVSSPRQSGEVQYYTTAQSDNQVDASSSLQSQSRVVGGYTTTTVKGGEERVIVQGQQQQQQPGAVHYSTTTVGSAPASSSSVSTSTVRQAAETGFSLALSVEEESSPVELKRVESEVRSVVGFAEGSEEAHLSADQVENLAAALQQPGRGSLLMSAGRREGWLVRTETGSYVIRVQRFCIWWVRQTRIEVLVQYLTRRFVGIRVIEQHGVRIRFFIPSAGSDGKTTVSKDTIFRVLSQEQAQLRIGSYDVADTSAAEVRSQVSSPRQSGEVQYYTTAQSDNQVDASSSLQSQSRVVGGYTTTTVKGGEERVIVQGQQQQQQPGAVHYSTTTVGSAPASSSSVTSWTLAPSTLSTASTVQAVGYESGDESEDDADDVSSGIGSSKVGRRKHRRHYRSGGTGHVVDNNAYEVGSSYASSVDGLKSLNVNTQVGEIEYTTVVVGNQVDVTPKRRHRRHRVTDNQANAEASDEESEVEFVESSDASAELVASPLVDESPEAREARAKRRRRRRHRLGGAIRSRSRARRSEGSLSPPQTAVDQKSRQSDASASPSRLHFNLEAAMAKEDTKIPKAVHRAA
ncbi:hypothetical protein Poli38472_001460 [Pythium oligandrum]|uniref:ABC transporter domain-containing protein n=1 Tax=Pythium oligandrum TaxID=41045 RepID=A0A8K1CU62_PYTOL|nr:hypothetical protein Poli38472_001460 [Pythium oligandrum]|eukprot:TMW69304.1 hypothetical protein Poli38472_001460 [Pythium oligandrum]